MKVLTAEQAARKQARETVWQKEHDKAWATMKRVADAADRAKRVDLTPVERLAWDQAEQRINDIKRARAVFEFEAPPTYDAAFDRYIRSGLGGLGSEDRTLLESRALATTGGAAGGFSVPQGYWARLASALKQFGAVFGEANVIETDTGNPLPWPTNDDTAGVAAARIAENTALVETDLVLGQKTLNAYNYTSGLVTASNQVLQDSGLDLANLLADKFAIRLARGFGVDIVNGTGVSQPAGLTANVTVGVTGSVGSTLVAKYADLVALVQSVDVAYRNAPDAHGNTPGAKFVTSDAGLSMLRNVLDSSNRPVFVDAQGVGDYPMFLGYPVLVDPNVSVPAANAVSLFFGNFRFGLAIRTVSEVGILRFDERFADSNAVAFTAIMRADSTVDVSGALRAYKHSAT